MIEICFINGSPRRHKSSSHCLISKVTEKFNNNTIYEEVFISDFLKDTNQFSTLLNFNHLVFCCPLYVDAIPAQMLEFLVRFEVFLNNNHHNDFNVSALVNCGFLEGHQTKVALEIFENFAHRIEADWKIGIGIGAGELCKNPASYSAKINEPVVQTIAKLSSILATSENYDKKILVSNPRLSRWLFKLSATRFWISEGKKNNLTKSDIIKPFKIRNTFKWINDFQR